MKKKIEDRMKKKFCSSYQKTSLMKIRILQSKICQGRMDSEEDPKKEFRNVKKKKIEDFISLLFKYFRRRRRRSQVRSIKFGRR